MKRRFLFLLLLTAGSMLAIAQESPPESESGKADTAVVAADTGETDATDAADAADDADTADEAAEDEEVEIEAGVSGTYDQNEDDTFVPTQEVSSDQALKFPVDI